MQSVSTLYDRLGGKEGIQTVVDDFYNLILADESVSHFFEEVDMTRQRLHQMLFISFATGGPNEYNGDSMEKVHTGMHIEDAHFDTIVTHLAAALESQGVPNEDIQKVAEKLEPLRSSIVGI